VVIRGRRAWSGVGAKRDRIHRQVVAVIEAGEVAKHAPIQRAVGLSLVLKVDEHRGRLAAQPGLHDQISLTAVGVEQVGEALLIEEQQRLGCECFSELGGGELQEFAEEAREQELEERVVVDRRCHHDLRDTVSAES
jgi:hypothetical protein